MEIIKQIVISNCIMLAIGFLLDCLFGDPHFLYHPVQGVGAVITFVEKCLRKILHLSEEREEDITEKQIAGAILVVCVLLWSVGIVVLVFWLGQFIWSKAYLIIGSILCYQMLAMHSLRKESMKVYHALQTEGLEAGRKAVAMIVGRDTEKLSVEGVTKATVETIAENTSDGVIAPLIYMIVFGPIGGFAYKAINTMDSMVGYKNDRYRYLGTAAAKLDDVVNYIPARISAILMIVATWILELGSKNVTIEDAKDEHESKNVNKTDAKDEHKSSKTHAKDGHKGSQFHARNAAFIWRRDRRNHSSPNSAQTEAVCAGALNLQLAGNATYFGKLYEKPTIGDANREIEIDDIKRANLLMITTSVITFLVGEMGLLIVWCCMR